MTPRGTDTQTHARTHTLREATTSLFPGESIANWAGHIEPPLKPGPIPNPNTQYGQQQIKNHQ